MFTLQFCNNDYHLKQASEGFFTDKGNILELAPVKIQNTNIPPVT